MLAFTIGPFEFGPNILWLDVHGLIMFALLIFSALFFGAIYFSKTADDQTVRRLKISAAGAFVALMLLMISGIIPGIGFGTASTFSGTVHNAYGTFANHVNDNGLGNFTGPLLFDMMEHVRLIVPGLAAAIGTLIFHCGGRVITEPPVRRSVLTSMVVTRAWTLIIGGIGG